MWFFSAPVAVCVGHEQHLGDATAPFPSTRAWTASSEEVPSLPAVALYLVSREAGLGVKREVIFVWEVA